jgi:hypothetical protein
MYNTKLHPNYDLKWTYFLRDANLCSTSQLGALSERPLELVKDLEEVDRDGAETEEKGATLTYHFRVGPADSLTAATRRLPNVDSVEALLVWLGTPARFEPS